ncbi:hypothetical protein L484_006553 [Morus notabilis]|uniref:Uncharacterized protein n=1 Tax=Morus notabilis TaxID=981085 RepID=W9S7Z0_9ROSA|nr:hypothetical protein L484_006553 [Morus notabilis]
MPKTPTEMRVPVRLFGTGRQPTYMKRRREGGFLDIKVSRRSKKATSGSNRCFGHSVDSKKKLFLTHIYIRNYLFYTVFLCYLILTRYNSQKLAQ